MSESVSHIIECRAAASQLKTGTELDIDLADVIHEQHQNEFVYTNTTFL